MGARTERRARAKAILACTLLALCTLAGDGVTKVASAQGVEGAPEPAVPRGDGQTIYRRKGRGGREVFTNVEEAIPVEERAGSRMDLSKTSLNSEVGNAIKQRVEDEHAALVRAEKAAGDCSALESLASRDTFTRLWEDDPLLIIGAGVVLLLVVFLPWMLAKVGVPGFLRMVIPVGVLVAAISYGMDRSHRSMEDFKAKLKPCLAPAVQILAGVPQLLGAPPPAAPDAPRPAAPRGPIQNVHNDLQTIEGMQEDRANRAIQAATE